MQIEFKFNSIWGNSFVDGSNNEPLPKGGRKHISFNQLNRETYSSKDINVDTIVGVLNRLVGETDKLYKIRQRNPEDYFLYDIDKLLTEEDIVVEKSTTDEVVYLRSGNDVLDPVSKSGVADVLIDDYSRELFSVLFLNREELYDFILHCNKTISQSNLKEYIDINEIASVFNSDVMKNTKNNNLEMSTFNQLIPVLKSVYNESEIESFDKEVEKLKVGEYKIYGSRLYCTALYIQLERMIKKYKLSNNVIKKLPFIGSVNKNGRMTISGFSKKTFTMKDIKAFGMKKMRLCGNPYFVKLKNPSGFFTKNGKETFVQTKQGLRKSDGKVTVNLNVTKNRAEEIRTAIKNARVTSFYLGKKGLAYISKIKI